MSTSWICVDANLLVVRLVKPEDEDVQQLWDEWRSTQQRLVAPTVFLFEVTNALYQYLKNGVFRQETVETLLQAALATDIEFHHDAMLHERALTLAHRYTLRAAYDAHYLALAERLGAIFWTGDQRLANSVRPHLPWVHLVGE